MMEMFLPFRRAFHQFMGEQLTPLSVLYPDKEDLTKEIHAAIEGWPVIKKGHSYEVAQEAAAAALVYLSELKHET